MGTPITPEANAAFLWIQEAEARGYFTLENTSSSGFRGIDENCWKIRISKELVKKLDLAVFYEDILKRICVGYLYDLPKNDYVMFSIEDNGKLFTSSFLKHSEIGNSDYFPALKNASGLTGEFVVTCTSADMQHFATPGEAKETIKKLPDIIKHNCIKAECIGEEGFSASINGELTYFDVKGKPTAISVNGGAEVGTIRDIGMMVYNFNFQLTWKTVLACRYRQNTRMMWSAAHFLCRLKLQQEHKSINESIYVLVEFHSEPKVMFDLAPLTEFGIDAFLQNVQNQTTHFFNLDQTIVFYMYVVDTEYLEISAMNSCEVELVQHTDKSIGTSEWNISIKEKHQHHNFNVKGGCSRLYGAVAVKLSVKKFPKITEDSQLTIRCEMRGSGRFHRFDIKGPLTSSDLDQLYQELEGDIRRPFATNKFIVRAVLIGPGGFNSLKEADEYLNSQAERKENPEGDQLSDQLANLELQPAYKVVAIRTPLSKPKSRTMIFKIEVNKAVMNKSESKPVFLAEICHELIESNGEDLSDRKQKMVTVIVRMGGQSYKAVFTSKENRTLDNIKKQLFEGKLPKIISKFELEVQYRLLK